MSKIQATFERLWSDERNTLTPLITAGDPDPTLTVTLMHTLVEAGADIIKLGVPFPIRWPTGRPFSVRPNALCVRASACAKCSKWWPISGPIITTHRWS